MNFTTKPPKEEGIFLNFTIYDNIFWAVVRGEERCDWGSCYSSSLSSFSSSPCTSEVQRVRLSRSNCMITVLSL